MQHRFLTSGAIAAALLVLPLTACGGDDSGGGNASPPEADLVVHALDTLKFDKSEYDAGVGDIDIAYINDGTIQHTLLFEGPVEGIGDFKLDVDQRGEVDTGTVPLTEGDYTIFCDVVGHRAGGMEAKLTVKPATAS